MSTIKGRLAIAAALMLMASQGFPQSAGAATTGTGTTTPEAKTATFNSLSPGNQNIARSLFEAQQPSGNGPAPLSLDQIAALKGKEGWGRVFEQMKAEGLVSAKNLGQVVSAHEHSLHAAKTGAGTLNTTTTAGGRTSVGATHHDNDGEVAEHAGHPGTGGSDHDGVSVTTAGGGTASAAGAGVGHGGSSGSHGGVNAHAR
jgi:hypothetical protein